MAGNVVDAFEIAGEVQSGPVLLVDDIEAERIGERFSSIRARPWPERPVSAANKSGRHPLAAPEAPTYPRTLIVDSRWTLTVVGMLLCAAGIGPVLPFALVDTAGRSGT
jgi:hypothetical protein